jgi:hypothetical protein
MIEKGDESMRGSLHLSGSLFNQGTWEIKVMGSFYKWREGGDSEPPQGQC